MSAISDSDVKANEKSTLVVTEGLINESGKNAVEVKCVRCSSKILTVNVGNYQEVQFVIPLMTKKPRLTEASSSDGESAIDGDSLSQFWRVDDIYKFENMGFTNTVNNTKYLVCADCEVGPLGIHDLGTKISYLALQRVAHH